MLTSHYGRMDGQTDKYNLSIMMYSMCRVCAVQSLSIVKPGLWVRVNNLLPHTLQAKRYTQVLIPRNEVL